MHLHNLYSSSVAQLLSHVWPSIHTFTSQDRREFLSVGLVSHCLRYYIRPLYSHLSRVSLKLVGYSAFPFSFSSLLFPLCTSLLKSFPRISLLQWLESCKSWPHGKARTIWFLRQQQSLFFFVWEVKQTRLFIFCYWINQHLFCTPEFILDNEVTEVTWKMLISWKEKQTQTQNWTKGNRYLASCEIRGKGKKIKLSVKI